MLLILLSSSSLAGWMLPLRPLQFYALFVGCGSFSCQERCKMAENIKSVMGTFEKECILGASCYY